VGDLSLALEHIRAGTIRPIGVTTATRAPLLPQTPAIGESIPGYAVPFWFGLFAAKQTAPEAIARLNTELAPLAAPTSELSRRMADRGSKLLLDGPAPLAARLAAEVPQWRQVIAAAGITPE
jgi:tripartite-type tricarboxylate transporter receptor subunit TctC